MNATVTALLATQAGDIELKIPKLSHGSFFPSLRRRIDQALHAVIVLAFLAFPQVFCQAGWVC